jgi:hypothetical protein
MEAEAEARLENSSRLELIRRAALTTALAQSPDLEFTVVRRVFQFLDRSCSKSRPSHPHDS